MCKIKDSKPKTDLLQSGYYAIFGDENIANICRKVQSTTIRNGNELQGLIFDQVNYDKKNKSNTFESLVELIKKGEDFYLSNVKIKNIKGKIEINGKKTIDVDAIVFKDKKLYIIEYKDGDALDTKKSQSEVESLKKLLDLFSEYVESESKLVLWRCKDLKNSSIKTSENREFITTGRDVSKIIDVDFNKIQSIRDGDQVENVEYFLNEVLNCITDENINLISDDTITKLSKIIKNKKEAI